MPRGGARPGAGRKPGALNLVTREAIARGHDGVSPLDYLLQVMRDESEPEARRFEAARAAAPYVHARLQPVNSNGESVRLHVVRALTWKPPS